MDPVDHPDCEANRTEAQDLPWSALTEIEWFQCYRCRARESRCDGGCRSCDLNLCDSCFSFLHETLGEESMDFYDSYKSTQEQIAQACSLRVASWPQWKKSEIKQEIEIQRNRE